jgi:hypothetical protein
MQIHRITTIIIKAINPLLRVFSRCTDVSKRILLNHAPMGVIEAAGCLHEPASFLAPGIINKTKAASEAGARSHSLPVYPECIFPGLEKCQCTFNLVSSGSESVLSAGLI